MSLAFLASASSVPYLSCSLSSCLMLFLFRTFIIFFSLLFELAFFSLFVLYFLFPFFILPIFSSSFLSLFALVNISSIILYSSSFTFYIIVFFLCLSSSPLNLL